MFELTLNHNELEALDSLLMACIDQKGTLPAWNYKGQNIWEMDFDREAPQIAFNAGLRQPNDVRTTLDRSRK